MVLKYVGGTMSLEMEAPKMLWLKRHMPAETFKSSMFFDLPDFLTYKATGDLARSNCSLACKCSYVPPGVEGSKGWNDEFFTKIGLEDFVSRLRSFARASSNLPSLVRQPNGAYKQVGGTPGHSGLILTAGQPVGKGISAKAAQELGLLEGTPVGSAVIDAYAGWVGTVAAPMEGQSTTNLNDSKHRLAAIAGTSTCHIVQSPEAVFVPGVWGPYKHAIFPGCELFSRHLFAPKADLGAAFLADWMNEGGQSSTGQLLDFMIDTHPASAKLKQLAKEQGTNHFSLLTEILKKMAKDRKVPFMSYLTKDIQLYPDLHGELPSLSPSLLGADFLPPSHPLGNRSPLADNEMRGMLIGMQLDKNVSDLALRYYATAEAIALQTRQIIDEMNKNGHEVRSIFMSGG
jgi:FGGY-family pentulose kinase